jgi:hypothetical protein
VDPHQAKNKHTTRLSHMLHGLMWSVIECVVLFRFRFQFHDNVQKKAWKRPCNKYLYINNTLIHCFYSLGTHGTNNLILSVLEYQQNQPSFSLGTSLYLQKRYLLICKFIFLSLQKMYLEKKVLRYNISWEIYHLTLVYYTIMSNVIYIIKFIEKLYDYVQLQTLWR